MTDEGLTCHPDCSVCEIEPREGETRETWLARLKAQPWPLDRPGVCVSCGATFHATRATRCLNCRKWRERKRRVEGVSDG